MQLVENAHMLCKVRDFVVRESLRTSPRRAGKPLPATPLAMLLCLAAMVAAALVLPASLSADELELTNGKRYYGKLVEKTDLYVTFRVIMGDATAELRFPANRVRHVKIGVDAPPDQPPAITLPPEQERPLARLRPAGEPSGLTWSSSNTKTRDEVKALVESAGSRPPDWWDSATLNFPKTLDLTWGKSGDARQWSTNFAVYLMVKAYPAPDLWKPTVKLLDQARTVNKLDKDKLAKTHLELGKAYHYLLADWARGAYWHGQVAGDDVDKLLGLAECYWKLGNKDMAAEILARFLAEPTTTGRLIKLWSDMGETEIALEVAEAMAQAGMPDAAYLAAGNACRRAGDFDQALSFYAKAAAAKTGTRDRAKNQLRARANIEAVKFFRSVDMSEVPDGTHTGRASGYRGPVEVKVTVKAGQIESAQVVRHKEPVALSAPEQLPAQIAEAQGPTGVNAVTGATATSDAIINATAKALAGAAK